MEINERIHIELNPMDAESRRLYDAYYEGADFRRQHSVPCTICREFGREEGFIRGHFHGSNFGACMLKTYRDMTSGLIDEELDKRSPHLMDGHAHEYQIFKNIAASPSNLIIAGFENDDQYQKQVQTYIKINKNGEHDFTMPHRDSEWNPKDKGFKKAFLMILHMDGLYEVQKEGKLYGIECKSVGDYTFNKLKKSSEITKVWYGQIQAYMLWNHSITTFYLIVKNRHSSKILKPIRIDRDDNYINAQLNKLFLVYSAVKTDDQKFIKRIKAEHDSSRDSECRTCPYKGDCYGIKNWKFKPGLNEDSEEEEEAA